MASFDGIDSCQSKFSSPFRNGPSRSPNFIRFRVGQEGSVEQVAGSAGRIRAIKGTKNETRNRKFFLLVLEIAKILIDLVQL